jgi:hypothetical protein
MHVFFRVFIPDVGGFGFTMDGISFIDKYGVCLFVLLFFMFRLDTTLRSLTKLMTEVQQLLNCVVKDKK